MIRAGFIIFVMLVNCFEVFALSCPEWDEEVEPTTCESFQSWLCGYNDWTESVKEWKKHIEEICSAEDLGEEWEELFSCPDLNTAVKCVNASAQHCEKNPLNCTICYCQDGKYKKRQNYFAVWRSSQKKFQKAVRLYDEKLERCGKSIVCPDTQNTMTTELLETDQDNTTANATSAEIHFTAVTTLALMTVETTSETSAAVVPTNTVVASTTAEPDVTSTVLLSTAMVPTATAASSATTAPTPTEKACYLGMKSGEIPDDAITSSTLWRAHYPASLGRLDSTVGWLPAWSQLGQWIQADLGESKLVAGVVTQGRFNAALWVTSFKIYCGSNTSNLQAITEHGADKIFSGNSDQNTKVVNKFPQPVTCRYIRVYPETWSGYRLSMRVEFIRGNCYNKY